MNQKDVVKAHWEEEVCGIRIASGTPGSKEYYASIDSHRYWVHPMLHDFAGFSSSHGRRVLEVGLGTGADFMNWVRAGAIATGRDLTEASVQTVKGRLSLEGLDADVAVGDAEKLEFPDDYFDVYYSWGVLHCTPDTAAAFAEAHRVLRPGGSFKVMIYHYPSVSAFLVWLLYGPLRLNFTGARALYERHVESPGTKLYSVKEARELVGRLFPDRPVEIRTYLGGADLMIHAPSARYEGRMWGAVRKLYPRWLIRRYVGDRFGTMLTIHTVK